MTRGGDTTASTMADFTRQPRSLRIRLGILRGVCAGAFRESQIRIRAGGCATDGVTSPYH